ncbi:MAG: glycerophosphodiester phosphodiesterase family protein [Polyangiaceae bacterium]
MVDDATSLYRDLPSPLLIGHRGLNTVAPENTLEAIAAAADLGVDGVEIDVRPTRDDAIVVFHDRDLARMANRPHRIEALDLRELGSVDLGRGARIPILDDVLDLCRQRGLFVNVELKRDVPSRRRLVRAVARCLKRHERRLPLVVSSFDPAMLADFRRRAPQVPLGVLYASRHRWVRRLAGPLRAAALHPDHRLVRAADLRAAHAAGRRVMCWTVNSEPATRRLLDMGIDGVMTDDPERLLPIFGRGAA